MKRKLMIRTTHQFLKNQIKKIYNIKTKINYKLTVTQNLKEESKKISHKIHNFLTLLKFLEYLNYLI